MEEAKLLLRLSERKNQEYQPASDGFVFSNDQIRHSIDLGQRLHIARKLDFGPYRPGKFRTQAA